MRRPTFKELAEESERKRKSRRYTVVPTAHIFNKNYFPENNRRVSNDGNTVIIPLVGEAPSILNDYNLPVYDHSQIKEYMRRNRDSWIKPIQEEDPLTKTQKFKKLLKNKPWRRSHYNAVMFLAGVSFYLINEYQLDPFYVIPASVIAEKWIARKFFVYKKRIRTKFRQWRANRKKK